MLLRSRLSLPRMLYKPSYLVCFFLLLLAALSCKKATAPAMEPMQPTGSIQQLQEKLEDANSDQVLVIAHRGDWRHAPENSIQAIENCVALGVDMVEIDVRMTKDSQLVIMHDETIDRTTNGKGRVADWTLDSIRTLRLRNGANHLTDHGIPTLEEALLACKGKLLVNLDKCYGYFDRAYAVARKTGTVGHIVMKGAISPTQLHKEFGSYLDEVYFMPIIPLQDSMAEQHLQQYMERMQPIAFELIFDDPETDLVNQFKEIRTSGSRVWVNTLWASLNGGYEDDKAVSDPDAIYGWLIDKGVNMMQTDRPQLLLNYLREKGLHD